MEDIKHSEEIITSESQELNLGESQDWASRALKAFPAFRHKNYQLYFAGQLVSLIGSWLQRVAQGWLILQLTDSAFLVGLVAALNTLPILFLALFSGIIIDSFSRKKIIMFTQATQMILALILGITTLLNITTIQEILILSFLLGVIDSLDNPARQSFVVDMVGKEDLHSAIALNSATFNAARIIGPAFAGLLIAFVGTGSAFIINGLSFLAVLLALSRMKVKESKPAEHDNIWQAIHEGVHFCFHHPVIRTLMVVMAANSIFGWSYATLMPVIAKNIFHLDATGLGFLYVAVGVGALLGGILTSAFGKRFSKGLFIIGGILMFSSALFIFSLTSNLFLSYILLFFVGLGLILSNSTVNTLVQSLVSDSLRGRVMSIYALMFLGFSPIGSFQVGLVAEKYGSQEAIRIGGLVMFGIGIYLYFRRKSLVKAFRVYSTEPLQS